jgi:hypothetical protein
VVRVVEPDREELAGPRHRRLEADLGERQSPGRSSDRGTRGVERGRTGGEERRHVAR